MTGLCRHDLFFSTLKIIFNRAGISLEPITAQPVYQPMPDSTVRLAWQVEIYALDGQNWWSTRVDASNRTVLDEFDYVIHDDFGAHGEGGAAVAATDLTHLGESNSGLAASALLTPDQYRVFAMPVESPNHGGRTLAVNPANLTASPFGWHDTNGAAGAESNYSKGNNVDAYEDSNNSNSPTGGDAARDFGGATLSFDYPIDFGQQPSAYQDAAITNLFYWNNIIHDVFYQYGFNEASGNFQENNYGKGGAASDSVNAEAQDGGGNNMALQLVVDGLKLQPCSPGFVDARNAILLADQNNYGGANQCLIWQAFAKRGLGYSASQGSSGSRSDGTQAFNLPPACQAPPPTNTPGPSPTATNTPGPTTCTVYNSTNVPISLPNGVSSINSNLTVSGGGTIADVNFSVNMAHVWVGDLGMTVTNQGSGTSVTVLDRPGVPATTYGCSGDNIVATLDDEAALPVENQCAGTVEDSDIVRFIPTTLGSSTSGSFQFYFDGSDVGLTTADEDIDALDVTSDGKLIISTLGSFSVTGASGNDEDLAIFTPTALGTTTTSSWAFHFDGSDSRLKHLF